MRIALDIKRIIEKTRFDIIRPQWIYDCVRQGELVPLRKKYFFHASPARIGDEEYDLSESEDESVPYPPPASSSPNDEDEVARTLAVSKASGSELESEHSEWFRVEPSDSKIRGTIDDSETEEDNDSGNQDSEEPDTVDDDDDDEWFTMPRESDMKSQTKATGGTITETESSERFSVVEAPQNQDTSVGFTPSSMRMPNSYFQVKLEIKEEVKMGEDDNAMQYDQDMIFRHL